MKWHWNVSNLANKIFTRNGHKYSAYRHVQKICVILFSPSASQLRPVWIVEKVWERNHRLVRTLLSHRRPKMWRINSIKWLFYETEASSLKVGNFYILNTFCQSFCNLIDRILQPLFFKYLLTVIFQIFFDQFVFQISFNRYFSKIFGTLISSQCWEKSAFVDHK